MTTSEKDTALATIGRIHDDRARLADEEVAAVSTARHHTTAWRIIADALGMAQPNAVRKFGKRLATPGEAGDPDQALSALRRIQTDREHLADEELHAVAAARTHGATWDEIAARMGRKTPNVQVSFAPKLTTTTTVADE
ncbi:SANT/Myb-like DNA-binding domain-containing protein [Streptomonospora litoralis]|uniref:Uncharacterized protein n=1 Tax=Streptomonospora litoralis TaxID=2498135 RepID=A0A4P6QAP2_9ACTN|nr:SANT/Myb-like DNA-binding domain-containing protein [Streptomonospora litoralis]QBI56831.1 hypothetical protein EKD16_25455 [Streptomonospora litoralis]